MPKDLMTHSSNPAYMRDRLGITTQELIPLSTRLILEQADELGVSWNAIPNTKIIKLEYNGKVKYFRWQISSETSFIGFHACLDKGETKALLEQAGVSTPRGCKLDAHDTEEFRRQVFESLTKPLVVKPSHGLQGESIFMDISKYEAYKTAVKKCLEYTKEEDSGVIVEELFQGREYRILATREKVLAVMYREPANVVGDGTSTVDQLLTEKNSDPRRGKDLQYALFIIEKDDDLMDVLHHQELSLESVPTADQKVYLRRVSNIMRGGDSIDVTDDVHPTVKEFVVKAVNAVPELDFVGVDFMTKDISQPQTADSYRIIEMNSSPGLCIHEFPFKGKKRFTDREFLFCSFPELKTKYANPND